jgi:hypothetical protein
VRVGRVKVLVIPKQAPCHHPPRFRRVYFLKLIKPPLDTTRILPRAARRARRARRSLLLFASLHLRLLPGLLSHRGQELSTSSVVRVLGGEGGERECF